MSDSALSLYPGNSQSVEDSLPQTWDHIALASPPVGCTYTAKQNRQRKDLSTSALSGCRMHRPLSISMVLML